MVRFTAPSSSHQHSRIPRRRTLCRFATAALVGAVISVGTGVFTAGAANAASPSVVAARLSAAGGEEIPVEAHLAAAGIPLMLQWTALGVLLATSALVLLLVLAVRRRRRPRPSI